MQISYQPTLVPNVARAVTLNYTDDASPAASITMFNVSLVTSTDPVNGKISATVERVDGNGTVLTDPGGQISATAEDVNEDAAVKAAALALGPRVLPAPTVESVSPAAGVAAGGTSVTITGRDLTGATAVTFGGVAATSFTVDSMMQITAEAPAGTVGATDVAVTAPGGTATLPGGFTYD